MRTLAFYILLIVGAIAFSSNSVYAQDDQPQAKTKKSKKDNNGSYQNNGNNQDALDAQNQDQLKKQMTPEQEKYLKDMAKIQKEKEKRNNATRKQADKRAAKRLSAAKKKTGAKKKAYVKNKNKSAKKKK
ncbi:MAG: outer membrane integrity protein [Cytophagaceae bacterium]